MKTLISAGLAVASFFLVAGHATDAAAQATRTWVSGVGDDVNPCSRTAPCKTFAGAISKTAAGGIIDVLDPGGFGAVTITKSITIRGVGATASILAAGTNGVVINAAATDTVTLTDLQIDGAGNGLTGVRILQAGQVNIVNCNISRFRGSPGTGVFLGTSTASRVTILDSVISGNIVGIDVAPAAAVVNGIAIDDTQIDANSTANLRANTANAGITLNRSFLLGGTITLTNGALLVSFGNNAIVGGSPTSTNPLK